jgi:hypothetical protein
MRGYEIDLPRRVLAQHESIIRGWADSAIPGAILPIYLGDTRNPNPTPNYVENNTAELIAIEIEPGVLLIRAMDRHAHELVEAAEVRIREAELSLSAKDVSSTVNPAPSPSQPRTITTNLPAWLNEYGAWAA